MQVSLLDRRYERTSLISFLLIGLLGGLLLAKFGFAPSNSTILLAYALLPFVIKHKFPALIALLVFGTVIGMWRGAHIYNDLSRYNNYYDQKVVITGKVLDDSAYADNSQLEFHIGEVVINDKAELPGRIRVRGFGAASVERGDRVEVSGKLRVGYGNRQGSMSFANIKVLSRSDSGLEKIRSEFFAGVFSAMPEPHASLGLGFLVGTRTLLPAYLVSELSTTGLSHIVAVSGYNLTILIRLMRRLFAKGSAYLSTVASLALIVGFLLVTGVSPSIARAAVVSTLALGAWYYGRRVKPSLIILLSAALTAFVSPFYLWFDLGWYLSFAAFFGVLVLAPLITKRIYKDKKPKILNQIIIETTSAQVLALPIIAVTFGQLSLISLLANVLVLPLIPLAMILTFVAGLAGMLVPFVAGWLAWPATFILTYIVDIVHMLARVPWALKNVDMSWFQLGIIYASVLLIILVLRKKTSAKLSGLEFIE